MYLGDSVSMRKHYQTYFLPILVFFILILPCINIKSTSTFLKPRINIDDNNFSNSSSLKLQQTINPNKTLLPRSNFSVTEFQDGLPNFAYNASILSINASHWKVECNYSRTMKFGSSETFPNEFTTPVTRGSLYHTYYAKNYYNWFGERQETFDYWINTTGFSKGYEYTIGQLNMSVLDEEPINLVNIGNFQAWKVNMTFSQYVDPMTYWYSKDGFFLCLYFKYISIFWYNLTTIEIAELPTNYNGPFLGQMSPQNNSHVANSSIIDIKFLSPYGVEIINYHWDSFENTTSTILQTTIPSENGSHELFVTVKDNIGLFNYFYFSYFTDYSIPGIFLENLNNNSHIQGFSQIRLLIYNGNGSIIYNWDGNDNDTISENTPIVIPNNEIVYELNVYIDNGVAWASKRFIFTVDNSAPSFSLQNLENNSVLKGSVIFQIRPSEDCNLTFKLNNVPINSFLAEFNESYEEELPELENGTHQLIIYAVDEAQNINQTRIMFSIYISAFNWNWDITAEVPKTINFNDALGNLWFILTITSSIDQYFNLSVSSEDSLPIKTEKMEYVIKFNCEKPDEIIFITLTFILPSNTSKFPVYQWKYWDIQSSQWANITTVHNEVTNSWEATFDGYVPYFTLINTGTMTSVKSITPGGGEIPSFEIVPALLSLITISFIVYSKRKLRKLS